MFLWLQNLPQSLDLPPESRSLKSNVVPNSVKLLLQFTTSQRDSGVRSRVLKCNIFYLLLQIVGKQFKTNIHLYRE